VLASEDEAIRLAIAMARRYIDRDGADGWAEGPAWPVAGIAAGAQ
jgi:hypothetical protein